RELYDTPANLFVAGFIGTPSMNIVPGIIEGGVLRSPLGVLRLQGVLRSTASNGDVIPTGDARDVILGIRPEDFRTTGHAPVGEGDASRIHVEVTAVEALGSDTYAYFTLRPDSAQSERFEDVLAGVDREEVGLGEAAPGAGGPLVARLP